MVLPEQDANRIESFREYIEDTVSTDDRYGSPVRQDSDAVLATRFYEGSSCWFEVGVLPANKQIRVGFFTSDPTINSDCEQVITDSGETTVRFVGQAFVEAGLDWPSPSVEHGKDGVASYYVTALQFEDLVDLDSDDLRDRVIRMLEGYLIAFGPALGATEEE